MFGHTHYTSEVRLKGLTVLNNQRGYVFPGAAMATKRDLNHEFNVARVLRV